MDDATRQIFVDRWYRQTIPLLTRAGWSITTDDLREAMIGAHLPETTDPLALTVRVMREENEIPDLIWHYHGIPELERRKTP